MAPAAQPMMAAVPPQPVAYVQVTAQGARQVQLINPVSLDHAPAQVACRHCGLVVVTDVHHQMGCGSWALAAGLCCFGVGVVSWAGILPCCMNDCKNADPYCPSCGNLIGTKKFLC